MFWVLILSAHFNPHLAAKMSPSKVQNIFTPLEHKLYCFIIIFMGCLENDDLENRDLRPRKQWPTKQWRILAYLRTLLQWLLKLLPPPRKGPDFPGGRRVNLPNFQVGRGVTIGKYFQRVLVMRKRVTKKKNKNLPRQWVSRKWWPRKRRPRKWRPRKWRPRKRRPRKWWPRKRRPRKWRPRKRRPRKWWPRKRWPRKRQPRKWWLRKRRPRKPILINNSETKKNNWKKKMWAEDLYKGKGRHLKRSLIRGEPCKLAGPVPVRSFRY